MHGHGRQGRHAARDVRHLRRPGPGGGDGAHAAGQLPAGDGVPGGGGSGQTFTPCETCGGDGRVRRSKRISLRVPAGVDSGSRLRVRGEGNAGRKGGPSGDLYVFVSVKEDPDLKRFESINVSSTVTIPYTRAILGTTQKVRTVDGEVDLKIPAGVQPGATLLMAKRGVPKLGQPNVRGDQYVTVKVTIPKQVSGEEKELVEKLDKAMTN